jgi:NADH:ubiquinone oxidoreductase subunit D
MLGIVWDLKKKMNYILSFDEIDFDLVTYCVIIED